jgi:hypothetical protein
LIRLIPKLSLLLLAACAARSPRFPGPLASVGRDAPAIVAPEDSVGVIANSPAPTAKRAAKPTRRVGSAIAKAANHYLDHRPKGFRDDCSGFVCASVTRAGLPLVGNTRGLWNMAQERGITHHRKVGKPGDLVFFDNTYDRNKNGRWDDPLSHIAIVIDVDADGTMVLAHGGTSKGRTTMTMNLKDPDNTALNSHLRWKKSGDKKSYKYLSGQLWRGFATLSLEEIDLAG